MYLGVEDMDFGLKSSLMGFPILHDSQAVIGHRFRESFNNYSVPGEHVVANSLGNGCCFCSREGRTHDASTSWRKLLNGIDPTSVTTRLNDCVCGRGEGRNIEA